MGNHERSVARRTKHSGKKKKPKRKNYKWAVERRERYEGITRKTWVLFGHFTTKGAAFYDSRADARKIARDRNTRYSTPTNVTYHAVKMATVE